MAQALIPYRDELERVVNSNSLSQYDQEIGNYLWAYTNVEDNAPHIAESGLLVPILKYLNKHASDKLENGSDKHTFFMGMISSVYNTSRWEASRGIFQQHPEALTICEKLMNTQSREIAVLAEFAICLIAGRDESGSGQELLARCKNIISNAINLIDRILEAGEGAAIDGGVWDPDEPATIILNLAISDKNKPLLKDAIPVLIKALDMRGDNQPLNGTILSTFQHLSFEPVTLKVLQDSSKALEEALSKCNLSSDNALQVRALKSRLKPEPPKERKASIRKPSLIQSMLGVGAKDKKPQLMISYNWGHQEVVRKIHASLVASGYKVWIDLEQMNGNIADRMAEAVEASDAVLVCISSKYKESINCRQEAEYAHECRKPMIILMMEKGYKANGWLGLMVGRKLWVDCTNPDALDMAGIVREIGAAGLGNGGAPVVVAASASSGSTSTAAHGSIVPSATSASSGSFGSKVNTLSNKAESMSVDDCAKWIDGSSLPAGVKTALKAKKADGKTLVSIYATLTSVPGSINEFKASLGCKDIFEFSLFFLELEKFLYSKN